MPTILRGALGCAARALTFGGSVRAQGKSPAQVVQRWAWQQNIVLNPRTHNIDYMKQNLAIFGADFELTAGEMKEISTGIPIPACEREPDTLPPLSCAGLASSLALCAGVWVGSCCAMASATLEEKGGP